AEVARGRATKRRWRYVINPARSEELQAVVIEVFVQNENEAWAPYTLGERSLATIADDTQRTALELLSSSPLPPYSAPHLRLPDSADEAAAVVASGYRNLVLPALAATKSLVLADSSGNHEQPALTLDDKGPWQTSLRAEPDEEAEATWSLQTVLIRGDEARPASDATLLLRDGLAVIGTTVSQVELSDSFHWVRYIRKNGAIKLPAKDPQNALRQICTIANIPDIRLPEPWTTERASPLPQVIFENPKPRKNTVGAEVRFAYGDVLFPLSATDSGYLDADEHRLVLRDGEIERKALEQLGRFGASPPDEADNSSVNLPKGQLDAAVRLLVLAGWRVEAKGGRIRSLSNHSLRLVSGQDWFDLEGEVRFGDLQIDLPELLRAVRQGDGYVRLDDGTHGILPEDWLKKYMALASLGAKKGKKLRFARSQAILLDMMLTEQGVFQPDQGFIDHREHIRHAGTPGAVEEPVNFAGELRSYQREGLGWLLYLERLGMNGCLADDMGLGKTVQLLALLAHRKRDGRSRGPSLVVAPRSLIFNWISEASRFTSELAVLDYTGLQRAERLDEFDKQDLIVTTYGTIRRDIESLRKQAFDYVILDEAQAIKNASAQASKACRLLQGQHRLALSGTPVENHLAELWSIFEFLNPGMLGSRREFAGLARPENFEALDSVSRGLRPLILRRTKKQVLQELPEKTELTIHVRLDEEERRMYNELRVPLPKKPVMMVTGSPCLESSIC
ncbi:MAG: SNF2-related protein, partial [Myxococcota bacterium]